MLEVVGRGVPSNYGVPRRCQFLACFEIGALLGRKLKVTLIQFPQRQYLKKAAQLSKIIDFVVSDGEFSETVNIF